jgi:hypothetical protein
MRRVAAIVLLILVTLPARAQQPASSSPPSPRERALEALLGEQSAFRSQCITSLIIAQEDGANVAKERDELRAQLTAVTKERDDLKVKPATAAPDSQNR